MADFCELVFIICFGLSWPVSIHKAYVSRTAKGKSIVFEIFILLGYVFGIIRKFLLLNEYRTSGVKPEFLFWFSWVFYFINITLVAIDLILFLRNTKLDRENDLKKKTDN